MDASERLQSIHDRIAAACGRAGRDPASVALLAVSKGQPPEAIRALAACGQRLFGENRVQEGCAKIPLCPSQLEWHLIGHLQSNKCRDAARCFAMVQGVDSVALAEELARRAEPLGRTMRVLIEVNVAGEASKFGCSQDALPEVLVRINALRRLEVHGLMTIAPWSPDPERARPVFRRLAELKSCCEDTLGAPLPCLSMGMSGDFEVAVEEGATMVRIGTALFGPRAGAWRPRAEGE
jgi:pyridoxal phosphate enzyme (YggS family)